jgi:hypothetical protein
MSRAIPPSSVVLRLLDISEWSTSQSRKIFSRFNLRFRRPCSPGVSGMTSSATPSRAKVFLPACEKLICILPSPASFSTRPHPHTA